MVGDLVLCFQFLRRSVEGKHFKKCVKGRVNGAFIWFELKFSGLAFLIFSAMYE